MTDDCVPPLVRRGFTLIELLVVVIAIIGILIGPLLPGVQKGNGGTPGEPNFGSCRTPFIVLLCRLK